MNGTSVRVPSLPSTLSTHWALAAVGALLLLSAARLASAAEPPAREILRASGITGGLVVHVGCGDGRLTAGLRAGSATLVEGLATDAQQVEQARVRLRAASLSGAVSVYRFDGKALPYVDNLANLVVAGSDCRVAGAEIARVLAPRGVALLAPGVPAPETPELAPAPLTSGSLRGWTKWVKRVPPETDEWTHWLHGPDGHMMSNDRVVGPPHHIQWVGSPQHARSHVHLSTMHVMVSGGGRLFYIADETPAALPEELPSRAALVARDAYNGVELWRRPLSAWQPYYVKDRNCSPADLPRRLVAAGGVVFATLSIHGPVSALDAATGRTLRTYAATDQTEEIIHEGGVLYLSINTGERKQLNRLQMAYLHVEPQQKRLMAIQAGSGKVLWQKMDADTNGVMPMTLAVKNGRLYVQNTRDVVCLEKASGKLLWRSARPSDYARPGWSSPNFVAFDDVVISADRQSGPGQKIGKGQFAAGGFSTGDLIALSAATGERLWSAPCAEGGRAPADVFSRDGRLWFGKALERNPQEYRQVHDLRTGALLAETPAAPDWPTQHHHRCYRDKATVEYILSGRTGIEFISLDDGQVSVNNWLRGSCKFGILPANGLIYLPPEQCGCYPESKLTGFHAVAPRRASAEARRDAHPLEQGPAYTQTAAAPAVPIPDPSGQIPNPQPAIRNAGDWPTFRADALRSGRAATTVPAKLRPAWRAQLGGRLTQPVVAEGRLYVASIDQQTLHALDAPSGRRLWAFIAGGRIDSPPTIAEGLAVFGCRDGWVYALRAADGRLAWRYRAAPDESRLVAEGRVESVWPVHGSVLVRDGVVYCAAGRSSYVDGGLRVAKLDLRSGRALLEKTLYSRDPKSGASVNLYEPFPAPGALGRMEMPGVLPDVISSDGERLWMRAVTFDPDFTIRNEFPPHLFCSMGFLDDSWWELTYWIYGAHMFSGRAGIAHAVGLYPTARIMVCDEQNTYGHQDGYEGIREPAFVASSKEPKTETVARAGKKNSRVVPQWRQSVPLHVQGLVLAGDTLFMAGPPRIDAAKTRGLLATLTVDEHNLSGALKDATETFWGARGGLLCAIQKGDGKKVAEWKLGSIPVFDGLVAANGRLFVSMKDGSVVCMGGGA